MAINIKSYNQILGDMIRKITADTPLDDVNIGSALLTLLEAAAQVDFENNASILNILELLNLDATRNNDLDNRAADLGISRRPARKATGFVRITDTSISKRSTGLYQVKLSPIAGSTQIYVNDASTWASTGQLFIGRGTANFEGPVSYTSIVNNESFFTINLASALEKDHLLSELVVDAQGTTDRLVSAGAIVEIPANNKTPTVQFRTLRNAIIPAGEDTISNVELVAVLAGRSGNAGINTIVQFTTPPFSGAAVTNTVALTNGADTETDSELRERIKSYAASLARGTEAAILSGIIGVSSQEDGKQVVSASLTEPPKIGDPSVLYIDDGSGFQPSYLGQSVDILLGSAVGNEEFLQLANFPLPRPQIINAVDGPFSLRDNMVLRVRVDGVEESIKFNASDFINIAAASIPEVITAINMQSELFKATFTQNSSRILLFPVAHDAEIIQVAPVSTTDITSTIANNVLRFPTNEVSYITLYKNNDILRERQTAATVLSNEFGTWEILIPGSLSLAVDGTPTQTASFDVADFNNTPFTALSLNNWVNAFNRKFAGITATATTSSRLQISSNKTGANSAITIVGGTYFNAMFADQETNAIGQNADFELNRQNGNLRILIDIEEGDTIRAGSGDTKGEIISTATTSGIYNVSTNDEGTPAEVIFGVDDIEGVIRTRLVAGIGTTLTITDQGSSVMRIMSSASNTFSSLLPDDFIYIVSKSSDWFDSASTGLFRVYRKGSHINPGTDTYIEVKAATIVPGSYQIATTNDIQAFSISNYPQLWRGTFTTSPAAAGIQDVTSSINNNLVNVKSSTFRTNRIKTTSTTELDGSIMIGAVSGNAQNIFTRNDSQLGNPPHIASKIPNRDAASFLRTTRATNVDALGVTGKTIWLNRYAYNDIGGNLDSAIVPGVEGVDTYGEELEVSGVLNSAQIAYSDIINLNTGNNSSHYRHVQDFLAGDTVGTQYELPRTIMSYGEDDNLSIWRTPSISPDDSIVFIIDKDPINKTIDIPMSRTGQINSQFSATDISFSANDIDNEPGINFGTLTIWGKNTSNTEFQDYAVWMRARNWYASGGAGSGGGSFMLRAKEYGPHGENIRFSIEYPSTANADSLFTYEVDPEFTQAVYIFGSGDPRPTSFTSGDIVYITDLGGDVFRYTFPNTVDFSTIIVGDVLNINQSAGFTAANRGQYKIVAVSDAAKTIDITNPNGDATFIGSQEVNNVDTIDDVIGSPTVSVVSDVAAAAGLDGEFFVLEDNAGTVAVYYDVGTPNPGAGPLGVNRVIVVSLVGTESDNVTASITAAVISADSQFTAGAVGTTITITNSTNGATAIAIDGTVPTGFSFAGTVGTDDVTVDGTFFTLQDKDGSVAVWYNVSGSTPEPLHGGSRSLQITTVDFGDNAATIAAKTASVINADSQFSTSVVANTITVTDAENGVRPASSIGTSGFTVTLVSAGVNDEPEIISIATAINVFPLAGTAVGDIVQTISESGILLAVVIDDSQIIDTATREESYIPAGPSDYSNSLAYEHDPVGLNNNYITLFDSLSWVKVFENTNPQFVLKRPLVLQGASSIYSIDSTINDDSSVGEYFKLVPTTLNNLYHQFTNRALSQLALVANTTITNNMRKLQITSKQLGSNGAVEVVGGNANNIDFSIFGSGAVVSADDSSDNYIQIRTRAFPISLTKGDLVEINNIQPARRVSQLLSSDSIDVTLGPSATADYIWNPKNTNINSFTTIEITDVSASYQRPAGIVWRWQHNDAGSLFQITDLTTGAPISPVANTIEDGSATSPALDNPIITVGAPSVAQVFQLAVNTLPSQADYFTFRSASGTTFAVWFDVDGAGTAPTGASYIAATHQIEIDILSADTPNQIMSKISTILLGEVDFTDEFSGNQLAGASLANIRVGNLLAAHGAFTGWNSGNKARTTGSDRVAGYPIIAVDSTSRYVDIVNPFGTAMPPTLIGSGIVNIVPTPVIEWNIAHNAKINIATISVASGIATATTSTPHNLSETDTIVIDDNTLAQTVAVDSVINDTQFTFTDSTSAVDGAYTNGNIIKNGSNSTQYRIESLGFNNIYRLQYAAGDAPNFIDMGVAIDDLMKISGSTFRPANLGTFRVLAVSNDGVVFESNSAVEELHTIYDFNNLQNGAQWVANATTVTGNVGVFKNITAGDWVKKVEDDDTFYTQVLQLLDNADNVASSELATKLILGSEYRGTTSTSLGVVFDQTNDAFGGVILKDISDIRFFESDAVRSGDSLFVDNIANSNWFNINNAGNFQITEFGTEGSNYRPYVRIGNIAAVAQSNRSLSVSTIGFFISESINHLYKSIREVQNSIIDPVNRDRRLLYLYPPTSVSKISSINGTRVTPIGKIGFDSEINQGVDGYTYYTGLLREVQRVIDGFEPDSDQYPGRRAVGGSVETLFPLIRKIKIAVDVTTEEGVNLNDIDADIRSEILNYVNNLNVARDVVLSELIVRIMGVIGVAAVTFTSPTPSTERISIADNESAFITVEDISIA